MHLSDESLIARIAQGDRNALEILYDRHAAKVLGFSIRITGERASAEELLQETFWQVWQSAGNFPSQHRSFTSWLFMIVRDLCSATNGRGNIDPRAMMETIEEDSLLDPNLQATQVRSAMRNLPHEQRQVIEMAYFQGMTRQQIANSTGETLDTISSRARLGLQKIQQALAHEDKIG